VAQASCRGSPWGPTILYCFPTPSHSLAGHPGITLLSDPSCMCHLFPAGVLLIPELMLTLERWMQTHLRGAVPLLRGQPAWRSCQQEAAPKRGLLHQQRPAPGVLGGLAGDKLFQGTRPTAVAAAAAPSITRGLLRGRLAPAHLAGPGGQGPQAPSASS
jgi:hypothetical protein